MISSDIVRGVQICTRFSTSQCCMFGDSYPFLSSEPWNLGGDSDIGRIPSTSLVTEAHIQRLGVYFGLKGLKGPKQSWELSVAAEFSCGLASYEGGS